MADLFHQIKEGSISPEDVKAFFEKRSVVGLSASHQTAGWQTFYHNVFGADVDFTGLQIPEKKEGFNWLVIISERIAWEAICEKCKDLFPLWTWPLVELERFGTSERRLMQVDYAFWLRRRLEADIELKEISASVLARDGVPGITLEERMLLELKYFADTGMHLDPKTITLCSGSRYFRGEAPIVSWREDRLHINGCPPNLIAHFMRSRHVVV